MGVMYEVDQSTGSIGDPVLDSSTGSGGGGGLTQEEHDALMSLAAYEPNMHDINPNLADGGAVNNPESYLICVYNRSSHFLYEAQNKMPVCGYKRIKVWVGSGQYTYIKFRFQFADNSFGTAIDAVNGWTDWITIPSNAVAIQFSNTYSSAYFVAYSLSTSES